MVDIFIIIIIIVILKVKGGILSRIVKVILFILLFIVFFEAGLISSYTIVTGQPPDVNKLISMQIEQLTSLFKLGKGINPTNQKALNLSNPDAVASTLQNKSELDGIDLQTLSVTTNESTDTEKNITVTITANAYKENQTGGTANISAITIRPQETYTITATARGEILSNGKILIDINSIIITTTRKLYETVGNIS